MTLTELIDEWFEPNVVLVCEARYQDDVIDAIDCGEGIPRECIHFCFDPAWSQFKCHTYLSERWALGKVDGFTLHDEKMIVFVDPKEGSDSKTKEERKR